MNRAIRASSILCPVDFSEHSRDALLSAASLARRSHGRLSVLFVNDPFLLAAAAAAFHRRRQFLERTRAELRRFVERSISSRGGGASVPTECFVALGDPADEILRAAKALRSDLLVIGTHGLSGADKLFFGSTTEQVLRNVNIPVLAIPPVTKRKKRRVETVTVESVDRIVAPIDLTGAWEPDARAAAEVARTFGAELMLVHVVPSVPMPRWFRARSAAGSRARIERAARSLRRVSIGLFGDLRTITRVVVGNAAEEIARAAGDGTSTLVVMSLRGTRGLWHARRGSIAYRVLAEAVTPVLALPRRPLAQRLSRRLATAVNRALSRRDQIEMAGIDALLDTAQNSRRRPR